MDITVHVQLLGKLDFQGINFALPNNFCRMPNKFEFPAADIQSKQRRPYTTNQHEAQIKICWAFYLNFSAKQNKRAFKSTAILFFKISANRYDLGLSNDPIFIIIA